MEENNTHEKNINTDKNCWKKYFGMFCAAFLGGFLAVYFVADQIMDRHPAPPKFNHYKFEKRMFDDIDKMYRNHHRNFEKMYQNDMNAFKEAFKINKKFEDRIFSEMAMPIPITDTVKIKNYYEDDEFKVVISLKPFQGDDSKINYNVKGRKLTVFGSSKIKEKDYEHDVAFSQDFILPENADIAKVEKQKDGDKLIISVPMRKQ